MKTKMKLDNKTYTQKNSKNEEKSKQNKTNKQTRWQSQTLCISNQIMMWTSKRLKVPLYHEKEKDIPNQPFFLKNWPHFYSLHF